MRKSPLEKLLAGPTISATREQHRPSTRFNETLAEWETLRGHDLLDKPRGWYAYFGRAARGNLDAVDSMFHISEDVRADIRDGADPDEPLTWSYNTPPTWWLESTAATFGWRLVPLARKTAVELGQPEGAFLIEQRVRAWLSKADVVWEILEAMPNNRKNRESFAAYIRPMRIEARKIEHDVRQWMEMHYAGRSYQ